MTDWKKISFREKVVFHALNGLLPCWGFMYPATKEFIENATAWINKKPE